MKGDGENNLRILYMYFENCQSAEKWLSYATQV